MNCQSLLGPMFALALLGATEAGAQVVTPRPDTAAPQANPGQQATNLPDACKLMPQSDLEALFPGRPITSKPPTLSPLYKGPQYPQICMYMVKLLSPTSKLDTTRIVSMNIIEWGGQTDGRNGTAAIFANMRSTAEMLANNPKVTVGVKPVPGLGEEAFLKYASGTYSVNVRKGDLIFIVSVDEYNPQTQSNALALAAQVTKRWKPGVGMVEAATPIAANSTVDIPEDTRASSVAPPEQWPDACALLTLEDVRSVFGDMKIEAPRKTMAKLTHMSRIDRSVDLPNPIRCAYQTSRSEMVNGERQFVVHEVNLNVSNVAATPELSKKYYESARSGGDGKAQVANLGDEAFIHDIMNTIYIRKGLLMVQVSVSGGMRDQAIHNDAKRRVKEIAKLVAAKLP